MPDHFHALDIPFLFQQVPFVRNASHAQTPPALLHPYFHVYFPANTIGAIPPDCLNLKASESESKSKLCGYLRNVLYFSTISLRLTITNLLLGSPLSSFNLENQTVEFTIQFSHDFSTSLCRHQIIFMLRTFHFLSFLSKNFHVDLNDFDSLLYIQLKFGRTKLY